MTKSSPCPYNEETLRFLVKGTLRSVTKSKSHHPFHVGFDPPHIPHRGSFVVQGPSVTCRSRTYGTPFRVVVDPTQKLHRDGPVRREASVTSWGRLRGSLFTSSPIFHIYFVETGPWQKSPPPLVEIEVGDQRPESSLRTHMYPTKTVPWQKYSSSFSKSSRKIPIPSGRWPFPSHLLKMLTNWGTASPIVDEHLTEPLQSCDPSRPNRRRIRVTIFSRYRWVETSVYVW